MRLHRRICLAVLLSGSTAFAQVGDSRVTVILRRGVELRQQGRDEAALQEFQRAYQLAQEPRVVAQVALAEQALGHWVDASNHIERALASHTDPWVQRNRTSLEQARQEIERHVGRLMVTGGVTGAEVFVDGERTAMLPMAAVPVLAGLGTLEVRLDGFQTVRRPFQITAGSTTQVRVLLVASALPTTHAEERPGRASVPAAMARDDNSRAATGVSTSPRLAEVSSAPRGHCAPRNRPIRILAEIGGFYVGALVSAVPFLVVTNLDGFGSSTGNSIAAVSTVIGATFTGALGAWGAGRLLGGDGGYGWTYLGVVGGTSTIVMPYYTAGLSSAAGAVLGFELSTGPQCNRDRAAGSQGHRPWWFLSPEVDVAGGVSRYGLVLNVVM